MDKIDIATYVSWGHALAILEHEFRKRPPRPSTGMTLKFSTGISHEDFWNEKGEHTSQNVPMFFITEVDN